MAAKIDEIGIADAHLRAGRLDSAIPIYRRILTAKPAHPHANQMLAIALFQGGVIAEAERFARRAYELKPASPDAANILAAILGRTGRYAEAADVLLLLGERLLKFPGMCLNLGLALRGCRRFDDAAVWLRHAADADSRLPGAQENLGMVLADLDRVDEAAVAFRAALALDPNNGNARHMLAALEGASPDAPPADYVRALFNDYAPRFERELTSDLGYRVPSILRGMIDARRGEQRFARVLDLGCGTGLSGIAVKDIADELVGIDLAPAMIAEARKKAIYTALFTHAIDTYLASNDAQRKAFDLVIAADVFIYVGKLDDVFATLAPRIAPSGLLAFSVERSDEADFALRSSGRYAHSLDSIHRLAAANGFSVVASEETIIRKASDGTVDGWCFVLERA